MAMRTTIGLVILLTCGVLGIVGANGRNETPRVKPATPPAGDELIVHEWGTFTNFSVSDGTQLEFRSQLGEELPPFVQYHPWRLLTKGELVARQRMETPVTYFYTDRPRTLDVRVDFPNGSLTEFYPPPRDDQELPDSSLAWHINVHPPAELAKTRGPADGLPDLPEVAGGDRYGFARQTDSAVVEVADGAGQKYGEKFLFYRGVGNFSLPLRLEAYSDHRFRVVNDGPDAIEALFMVLIDNHGLHFERYSKLAAHAALIMQVSESTATADALGRQMAETLVAAGLFKKEAQAMVDTWRSSWFSEPGARLFYLVPRNLTDAIIPLSVDPAPDHVVRVLVGRMETLTPEAADRLGALAKYLESRLLIADDQLRAQLHGFGRFAEPALTYLASQTDGEPMRESLKRLRILSR
jgi:hypothetical protein